MVGASFCASDLVTRKLARGNRVEALDALRGFTVGDRLYFKRVQLAKLRDLVEGQRGIVNEPDGCCLGHKQLLSHGYSPFVRRAGVAGRGVYH
ncbi:hypothetical protein D9M70_549490 [compost metagenome]